MTKICKHGDFEKQLRSLIIEHLPVSDRSIVQDLQNLDTGHLLVRYLTWRSRIVHPHQRRVFRSRELQANPIFAARREEINVLCAKAAIGADLTPHLSKRVQFGYEPFKGRGKGRDFDGLLADWGIHHFHISHQIQDDGFTARGDDLLAVIVERNRFYCLDVICHRSWSETRLIAIAVSNWPSAGLFSRLHGAMPSNQVITDDEHMKLRMAGVVTTLTVNGVVYMPRGGGITTALTPVAATVSAQKILRLLREYSENPSQLPLAFQACDQYEPDRWPKNPVYKLVFATTSDRFCFVIQELKTELCMSLE